MTKALTILIAFCLSFQAAIVSAQTADSRSNARMLQLQTRVDELYERGEFERAFLIYRDELASIGDKYAQYMVGYMTLSGKGVQQDPIKASAWYRISAERGTEEFELVRDELLQDFDASEMQRADQAYRSLCRRFCDVAVLLSLVRKDLEEIAKATGSRVGSGGIPMTIIDRRTGLVMSGDEYYRRVRQELEVRLGLIARLTGTKLGTNPDDVNILEVERAVEDYLRELP